MDRLKRHYTEEGANRVAATIASNLNTRMKDLIEQRPKP
jgi:hypothetical protein